jgi:hypothetical protein
MAEFSMSIKLISAKVTFTNVGGESAITFQQVEEFIASLESIIGESDDLPKSTP